MGIAATLVASCSIHEKDFKALLQENVIFYASFEQPTEQTKVYANGDLYLRWTADDRVSIFNKLTYNQQYKFTGNTGANAGGFKKVDTDEFVTGNPISHVVSVYPYEESTEISENEVLTLTLPDEQHYAENTFGLGANTMVAISEDNVLQYKNVGGYLRVSFYGEGVSVSSITLKGNNGEKLAGKASVTMPLDGTPAAILADNATDQISLVCDTPVTLGSTADESVDFWFVVPPVSFSEGFTVSVSQANGSVFEKSTSKSITIDRSKVSKMSSMEVEKALGNIVFADEIVKNKLVAAFDTNGDGELSYAEAASVSSIQGVFDGTKTIESFDEFQFFTGVTSIPAKCFARMTILSSIALPESIRTIGNYAFTECSSLKSVHIPQNVSFIGYRAFEKCSSLSSVTFSENAIISSLDGYYNYDIDGNSSLFGGLFAYCDALTHFVIPASVTSLGSRLFYGCASLKEIVFAEGSTIQRLYGNSWNSVGGAFNGCQSVETILLPDTITSIGFGVFANCRSLKNINLPTHNIQAIGKNAFVNCVNLEGDFVFSICESVGDYAFSGCAKIHSISLADNCTSVGTFAFKNCSNLESVTLSYAQTRIENYTFVGCSSLKNITLPSHLAFIGGNAFEGCTSLTSITIPEGVVEIQGGAFFRCSSLSSITFSNRLEKIGAVAFQECTSLTTIYIPESVSTIESYAFSGCTGLTKVIERAINPPAMPSGKAFNNTNNLPYLCPIWK